MNPLFEAMLPEIILAAVACLLLLLGAVDRAGVRKVVPIIALLGLVAVFAYEVSQDPFAPAIQDSAGTFFVYHLAHYIKMIAAGIGVLFVLLAWPSNPNGTGNASIDFGAECGEFFGLMLLSITGIFLVAGSNDLMLLFLGIELASLPTYIMVSISRPIAAAQEAGVKYFFLGAMAAAILLFGFSYLFGTTGSIDLNVIGDRFRATAAGPLSGSLPGHWMMLAVLMTVAGLSFKLAAVPLHFYAGDVYQGAATPMTALLSFVPKTAGIVALIKILYAAGGNSWAEPDTIVRLLWIIAVLTMCVGNVLGLLQANIKRVLAYSSIAHSGYMLVGLTALAAATAQQSQNEALQGVLFYLAAYGIMNAGAFGVLMLLPARPPQSWSAASGRVPPTTTAETFEDIAGQGRRHPALGLAMAVCCFSLIGLPLTIGFFGKVYLIRPALDAKLYWLVVIMMANAAVSAAYYLKIVAAMFLRPEPTGTAASNMETRSMPLAIRAAITLSVFGTLFFGIILPGTQVLVTRTISAAQIQPPSQRAVPAAVAAR